MSSTELAERPTEKKPNKPVHLIILVGERHHAEYLVKQLKPHLPLSDNKMRLEFLPLEGPKITEDLMGVDALSAQAGNPDQEVLFLCWDLHPSVDCIERTLSYFKGRASVIVIETNEAKLIHELHPDAASRAVIERSIRKHNGLMAQLLPKIPSLRHRHPLTFTFLEHGKSVQAQAQHAHFRISLSTGRRTPACS